MYRTKLAVAIETWLDRVPDFHIPATEVAGLTYNPIGMFSLRHLPLEWSPPAR